MISHHHGALFGNVAKKLTQMNEIMPICSIGKQDQNLVVDTETVSILLPVVITS